MSLATNRGTAANPESIRSMFSSISSRYDLANSVLSFGIHHAWRKSVVAWSGVSAGRKVLDCASGTGDLAFEFERAVGETGEVVGTDFCEEMLRFGVEKGLKRGSHVRFQVADVMNLPFESESFDAASIAFGIRNVADPVRGLSEMGRVVKPGGHVLALEFGQSELPLWGSLFEFYSKAILPRVGGLITGKRDAYEYLQTSSAAFPCRDAFLELARSGGCFDRVEYKPLMGGIAYIYKLRKRALA